MATVKVAQESGTIAVSTNGDPAVVYAVTKGRADVPPEGVAAFLANVPGSEVVAGKASPPDKPSSNPPATAEKGA